MEGGAISRLFGVHQFATIEDIKAMNPGQSKSIWNVERIYNNKLNGKNCVNVKFYTRALAKSWQQTANFDYFRMKKIDFQHTSSRLTEKQLDYEELLSHGLRGRSLLLHGLPGLTTAQMISRALEEFDLDGRRKDGMPSGVQQYRRKGPSVRSEWIITFENSLEARRAYRQINASFWCPNRFGQRYQIYAKVLY